MNARSFILFKQRIWANSKGLKLIGSKVERGESNYTTSLNDNLFMPLTKEAEKTFKEADGNELDGFPCKMQALHSSSALAVNIFQYWMDNDVSIIASACGLCRANNVKREILFEKKYPISASFDIPPNIDVVINNIGEQRYRAYAVECKFTEPYSQRAEGPDGLKEKYLCLEELWDDIPETYKLAKSISPNDSTNKYLHSAQLIKHILGLRRAYGKAFRLLYLWYDVIGEEGYQHRLEIGRFRDIVRKDNIAFHAISYQELIFNLHNMHTDNDIEYLDYIEQRYL